MAKVSWNVMNVVVSVALTVDTLIFLTLGVLILGLEGWLAVALPYFVGSIPSFILLILWFLTLNLPRKVKLFINAMTSVVLLIYGLVLISIMLSLINGAPWHGWAIIVFLGIFGALNISFSPFLLLRKGKLQ